jgi:hypothetical protein
MSRIHRTILIKENLNNKSKGMFVEYFDRLTRDIVAARITGRHVVALDVQKALVVRLRNPLPEAEDPQEENYALYRYKELLRVSDDILEIIAHAIDF